jgi:adenylosuccinate lyase
MNQTSFRSLIESDPEFTKRLPPKELAGCFDLSDHTRHISDIFKRAGIR